MAAKWFVSKSENVTGPYSSEQLQTHLSSATFSANDMVWGRGLEGWRTLNWWRNELPQLTSANLGQDASPNLPDVEEAWHYALSGKSYGPYLRLELIDHLKHVSDIAEVMLWTKGMKEWAPVFEFHDILSKVGVNKRIFPRAELKGKAIVKVDGATLLAPLLTISEGGLGLQLESGLVSGQNVEIELQSPSFASPLNMRAEVRYAADGVVGLRFLNLNSETKGAISTFVRQNHTRFNLKAA